MKIKKTFSTSRLIAVLLGNVILGAGCALLRLSGMGNDPFSAACMAYSSGLGVGLGNFQLSVNLVLLLVQLIWGRTYLGIGSVVNLGILGYIVQFFSYVYSFFTPEGWNPNFGIRLLLMAMALILVAFGLDMYQCSDMGVSPYDFLSLEGCRRFKKSYVFCRVLTDSFCVAMILCGIASGLLTWKTAHLGLGTVISAFFLGSLVSKFSAFNKRWIKD